MQPSSISLKVYHQFKASHSLEGFEIPHFHLWKITVEFKKALPLEGDRLIDLVLLHQALEKVSAPLNGGYLNDLLKISPTSENMAAHFWKQIHAFFPNQPLHSVSVALCHLDGEVSGEATLT